MTPAPPTSDLIGSVSLSRHTEASIVAVVLCGTVCVSLHWPEEAAGRGRGSSASERGVGDHEMLLAWKKGKSNV